MSRHPVREVRYFFEFLLVAPARALLRLYPRKLVELQARLIGTIMFCIPELRREILSTLLCALPETGPAEARRIGRASCVNLVRNLMEYFWMSSRPDRIERCCAMPEEIAADFNSRADRDERLIIVTPHLGGWEAAGVIIPYFSRIKLGAIAKPMKNPRLDRILNSFGRQNSAVPNYRIIFSRGAVRGAIELFRDGYSVATLIDQNTRVSDGGVFTDFFGIPAPCSPAPATFLHYCRSRKLPASICFVAAIRREDGKLHLTAEILPPELESAEEILAELIRRHETFIRQYPEQYLWMYKRFRHIPPGVSPEIRARFPDYARDAKPSFFHRPKPETK